MLLFALGSLMTSTMVYAQKSPPATAMGKVGAASITITYSSPSVRGRKIWGDLVPYGKAWRAGANEATTFLTDKDITVEGKTLKAGKYSVFIVPTEKEWEFIFNSETGQWGIKKSGDANFDPAKNAITFKVKPKKSASMAEQLTYAVSGKGFSLHWENMEGDVAIK
jgi:hypothetical protein